MDGREDAVRGGEGRAAAMVRFLDRMDEVLPWAGLEEMVRPYFPRAGGRTELSTMLRVHCVQLFYDVSDGDMEDLVHDSGAVRRFVGGRPSELVPDEGAIRRFRLTLDRHGMGGRLLGEIRRHLGSRGMVLRRGKIEEPRLVKAPPAADGR